MSDLALALLIAVIACVIGGALGGYALARPDDALRLAGLKRDEGKPHGLSEARATYGGLFLVSHAGAAAMLGYFPSGGAYMALALGLAWLGAAGARAYSMARDKAARTRFNLQAAGFEALMGAALILPFWTLAGSWRGGAVLV